MNIESLSQEERDEIVQYGMQRGKVMLVTVLVTLILGLLMRMFWQSVVFLFSFSSIRRYAGGYHAKSQKACYVVSLLALFLAFCYIKYVTPNIYFSILLQIICTIIIFLLAPVETENKKLDKAEIQKYRDATRIRLVIAVLAWAILTILMQSQFARPIEAAELLVGILVIWGKASISHIKSTKSENKTER